MPTDEPMQHLAGRTEIAVTTMFSVHSYPAVCPERRASHQCRRAADGRRDTSNSSTSSLQLKPHLCTFYTLKCSVDTFSRQCKLLFDYSVCMCNHQILPSTSPQSKTAAEHKRTSRQKTGLREYVQLLDVSIRRCRRDIDRRKSRNSHKSVFY